MKNTIHPDYFEQAQIHCVCGIMATVGSTVEHINVELCSRCHPFYTGKQKLIDTAGRVDRYKRRAAQKTDAAALRKGKRVKRLVTTARKAAKKKETQ